MDTLQEADVAFTPFFPPPPPYFKDFLGYRRSSEGNDGPQIETPSPLWTPPKPIQGKLRMFGREILLEDLSLQTPTSQNLKDIGPSKSGEEKDGYLETLQALKKFGHAVAFNFAELLQIVLHHPTTVVNITAQDTNFHDTSQLLLNNSQLALELKIEQIRLILLNMVYMTNSLRPNQAREQIISILKEILEKRKLATEKLEACNQQCKEMLHKYKEQLKQQPSLLLPPPLPHDQTMDEGNGTLTLVDQEQRKRKFEETVIQEQQQQSDSMHEQAKKQKVGNEIDDITLTPEMCDLFTSLCAKK